MNYTPGYGNGSGFTEVENKAYHVIMIFTQILTVNSFIPILTQLLS